MGGYGGSTGGQFLDVFDREVGIFWLVNMRMIKILLLLKVLYIKVLVIFRFAYYQLSDITGVQALRINTVVQLLIQWCNC